MVDEYLFITLIIGEIEDSSKKMMITANESEIIVTKPGAFPSIMLQSRGNNLIIHEFGARSTRYTLEAVNIVYNQRRFKLVAIKDAQDALEGKRQTV